MAIRLGIFVVAIIVLMLVAFILAVMLKRQRAQARKNRAVLGVVAPRVYQDLSKTDQARVRDILDEDKA